MTLHFLAKWFLLFIFNTNMLSQIYQRSIENTSIGEYFGSNGLYEVYMKIEKNAGYVDVFYIEKRPTFLIFDTIRSDLNDNFIWSGKTFMLSKKNNFFYIDKKNSDLLEDSFPIKVKKDSTKYRKLYKRKNELLFYDGLSELKNFDSIDYKTLNNKINENKLFEKIKSLKPDEFKIEFEKFTDDLKKHNFD